MWDDFKVELLRQSGGLVSPGVLCVQLGVSRCALQKKAQRIGVKLMPHGSNHHLATITDEQVNAARRLRDSGEEDKKYISRITGINRNTLYSILRGEAR